MLTARFQTKYTPADNKTGGLLIQNYFKIELLACLALPQVWGIL